jgi:hypothetical protein
VWSDVATQSYEIVRWDDQRTQTVVQSNIRTYEKAHQALADWRRRAATAKEQT